MITAKIILDSKCSVTNKRITTWILKCNRYILAEINTHRMLSRNSASSRARPINKVIEDITFQPAYPIEWSQNVSGMQSPGPLPFDVQIECQKNWLEARDLMIDKAKKLMSLGLHKQIANRILEPWMHQVILCTATEWENFFSLRAHKDAQPEFRNLAYQMLDLYNDSKPTIRNPGEWHIPFSDQNLEDGLTLKEKLKICTARAARVSYVNFEGDFDKQKDFDLHDRLISSGHWSPLEHAAKATDKPDFIGNFCGWMQYRKLFNNENRKDDRVIHV